MNVFRGALRSFFAALFCLSAGCMTALNRIFGLLAEPRGSSIAKSGYYVLPAVCEDISQTHRRRNMVILMC